MSARLHTVSDDTRPAVEVHALRKTYPGGIEAVRGVDFQVAPGEVFGLLGPNGAGKSTTIGMLTTTIKPTSGSARLAGFDVARHPIAARSVSSVVFQESVLDKALTGRRNLDLHARLWGIPPSAAASGGAWRSPGPWCPNPECCSSTSRRWGWTPASAMNCWTCSAACAAAP